uniref:Uncharacterized protein n=1 Tax=Glossina pallidipes TaxID=7398 RepID=A0A1B0A4V3_GLOPL
MKKTEVGKHNSETLNLLEMETLRETGYSYKSGTKSMESRNPEAETVQLKFLMQLRGCQNMLHVLMRMRRSIPIDVFEIHQKLRAPLSAVSFFQVSSIWSAA